LINGEPREKISESGEILQKTAGEIANGMLSEKLAPPELLEKTEKKQLSLSDFKVEEVGGNSHVND
jgi:hypothetical protein